MILWLIQRHYKNPRAFIFNVTLVFILMF